MYKEVVKSIRRRGGRGGARGNTSARNRRIVFIHHAAAQIDIRRTERNRHREDNCRPAVSAGGTSVSFLSPNRRPYFGAGANRHKVEVAPMRRAMMRPSGSQPMEV